MAYFFPVQALIVKDNSSSSWGKTRSSTWHWQLHMSCVLLLWTSAPWLFSAENYFIVLARINWCNRLLPFLKLNWTATQLALSLVKSSHNGHTLLSRICACASHLVGVGVGVGVGSPPTALIAPWICGIRGIRGMRLRTMRHGHGNFRFFLISLCIYLALVYSTSYDSCRSPTGVSGVPGVSGKNLSNIRVLKIGNISLFFSVRSGLLQMLYFQNFRGVIVN